MSNSNSGFFGKLLTFFLGMIFGMIALVAGLAGGAYWAYTKVKISDIERRISKDLVGDDYKDDTIKEFVAKLSALQSGNLTFGDFEKIFKVLEDSINSKYPDGKININISGANFAQIDLGVIRSTYIKNLAQNAFDAVDITATLRSLSALGFDVDSMPIIIKGGGTGSEVDIYTLATKEDFSIKNTFKRFDDFYTKQIEFEEAEIVSGSFTGKYRYYDEYFIDGIDGKELAVDANENGTVIDDYPALTEFFVQKTVYNIADETEIGAVDLYVLTDGIADVPLIEAMGALSSVFDFEKLTLNDMQSKLGISLGDNFMLNKIKDVPINKLGQGIDDEIDNITLVEILGEPDGSNKILSAIMYDGEEPVKIGGIQDRLSMLKMKDIMEIDTNSVLLLQSLQDELITDIGDRIGTLKIYEIINIPEDNNILNAIKNQTLETLHEGIDMLTLQDVVGSDIYDGYEQVYWANGTFDKDNHSFKTLYTYDGISYTKLDRSVVMKEDGTLQDDYIGVDLYAGKVKSGMWQYLVMKDDGFGGKIETGVLITNLGSHMDDVATNISNSTLREMYENEIIALSDEAILERNAPSGDKIGDMNITEMLDAFGTLLDWYESYP